MTLIALTLNHGNPILMSDLLISSTESEGSIETPTFVEGTGTMLTSLKGSKPMLLSQKLYVINDRLCVALGGRGDQMYTFLKRLKALYGSSDFDDKDFKTYIEKYPIEEKVSLLAIILITTQVQNEIKFTALFIGNVKYCDNERYEKVLAAGSGADQFLNFITTNPKYATDITNVDSALAMNQYLMGYWIGHEMVSAASLSNKWGAGFEMVIFRENKFVKLEEYTVVLLHGKIGKGVKFDPAPINTIMFSYQDDVLIIRAFASNIEKIFAVPAIDEIKNTIELLDNNDPNHNSLLITYVIKNVDNGMYYFPTIVFPRNKNNLNESPLKIERVGQKLRVYTSKKLDDYVENTLKKWWQ